jgi:alanine racemase
MPGACAATRLTIDLDALAANFHVLRAEAPTAEVAPVVKSDGYGLGAVQIARRLWAEGARSFFVARLTEGEALRAGLGPTRPAAIYVLDGLTPGADQRLRRSDLIPVLHSLPQIAAADAIAAASGKRLTVALQIDTGMNRLGLRPEMARALVEAGDRLRRLDVTLVLSHLGSAAEPDDPRSAAQFAAFQALRPLFPETRASLAASAGVFLGPDHHFEIVRPGISLYGGGPLERPDARLQAVARLEAPILDIRTVQPGEQIGYGSRVRADRPMRLAIVGAGYSDGVLRASGGLGHGWLRGLRPTVSVTMDLIALELGEAPAQIGEMVELLGPNVLLDDLAAAAGTVAHECLVRLSARAERVYLGEV